MILFLLRKSLSYLMSPSGWKTAMVLFQVYNLTQSLSSNITNQPYSYIVFGVTGYSLQFCGTDEPCKISMTGHSTGISNQRHRKRSSGDAVSSGGHASYTGNGAPANHGEPRWPNVLIRDTPSSSAQHSVCIAPHLAWLQSLEKTRAKCVGWMSRA